MRLLDFLACAVVCTSLASAADDTRSWTTLTGRVVFPTEKPVPERSLVKVEPKLKACVKAGPLFDETRLVNRKNRGIKNVVVWLRPDDLNPKVTFTNDEIHPSYAKRKPVDVVIDIRNCQFHPHITTARIGDKLVIRNLDPIPHNFFSHDQLEFVPPFAPNQNWQLEAPLKREKITVYQGRGDHLWMTCYLRLFDHSYYSVTDADGKFTIPNAPTGKYRIVYWHEATGFLNGAKGRFGEPITITGKTQELKPTELDVSEE